MGYPKHPRAIFAFLLVIINSSATQVEPLQFLLGLPLTLPPPPITLPPTQLLLPIDLHPADLPDHQQVRKKMKNG